MLFVTAFNFLFESFSTMRSLSLFEIVIRIILSIILGGILGMERGIKNRPAGLRTYILVTLGASVIMMINQYITQVYGGTDPVRMGAQVVSGIGFLGAGSIVVTAKNQIRGLTTAASLWASAANGLAIGIGAYEIALLVGLLLYVVVEFVHRLDSFIASKKREIELCITMDNQIRVGDFVSELRTKGFKFTAIEFVQDVTKFENTMSVVVSFINNENRTPKCLKHEIMDMEGVYYVETL